MRKSKLSLVIFVATILGINSCAQNKSTDLNLSFEKVDLKIHKPSGWFIDNDPNYTINLDSSVTYQGTYSLKIKNAGNNSQKGQYNGVSIAIENIQAHKSIKLTGFIKTRDTELDSIGLVVGIENFGDRIIKHSKNKDLMGTHDWKEYSVELELNTESEMILIGAELSGKGTIWVDDLKLFIDGKQIFNIPALDFVANRKQINWLQNHATKISTVMPENGFADLQPLKKMIGDARIVGLGEYTHGTSEVFKMKHRLIEFLATEMGFTIFSIELDMPHAYKFNDYVLYGKGDPKELLKSKGFYINTQETLDMIEWMRKFNISGKSKIQFTGFDMQFMAGALENLNKFAEKHDLILKCKIDSISKLLEEFSSKGGQLLEDKNFMSILKQKCEDISSYLTMNKNSINHVLGETEYKWLVQNATITMQSAELGIQYKNIHFRDECMAKNIDWILDNNPNAKIILWAHNGHIRKVSGWLGNYLSEKYGKNYYNIGFVSNSGNYTAVKSGNVSSTNHLAEGQVGSFEYSFHKIGIPCFFFDFSLVNEKEPESLWLNNRLSLGGMAAVAVDKQFSPIFINKWFNSIIYIDSTNASHPLADF